MKIPFLLSATVCLLLLIIPAGAQPAGGSPQPSTRNTLRSVSPPAVANAPGTPAPADESKLTRFDLDFPGGTPAELAAAISKAMGKHLNLVIPTEQADMKIMPLKVRGVTVPELFTAISQASLHQVFVATNRYLPQNFESRQVSIQFLTNGPISDETVWSFSCNAPTAEEITLRTAAAVQATPPQVCRYFQLASYLENYSIEDITTAIQTGWRMAKVEPMPQLSFHKETKLLIAVGPEANVNQIPAVLNELQRDRGPAVARIAKLQAELDAIATKQGPEWDRKRDEIQQKMAEIAQRQSANELIDRAGNPRPRMLHPPGN